MNNLLNKPYVTPLLCFMGGSLCALTMAPYNIWPIFLIGFGVLYVAIAGAQSKKAAFGYSWIWAFGYFVFSLYWIGNALLVEGNPYKWAWPLAVVGLPALLAFFNAFACLIAHRFLNLKRWHGYLGFASLLSLFEWLRGHLFTGFPWNLYGYTWIDMPIAQLAAFESVYFLTFITLFWTSIVGFWIAGKGKLSKRVLNTLILITFFGSFYHTTGQYGMTARKNSHDTLIKIVQPNTPQHEKWQRDKMEGHFETALRLSRTDGNEDTKTIILWPETTLSPTFLTPPHYRARIAGMLREYEHDAILMTGALRYEAGDKTYHNSLLTIDASGNIDRVYDKSHLVPFGEYIPFQSLIPLAPVTQFQGFRKGNGLQSFELFEDLKYTPLICYEVIFPNKVVPRKDHTDFIVNVTNDAWYGDSAGPRQHLVKAQFRAIEERLPTLRAANTGISAIIDPYGRILSRSDTFTQEVFVTKLPFGKTKINDNFYVSLLLFPLIPLFLFILAIANSRIFMLKD